MFIFGYPKLLFLISKIERLFGIIFDIRNNYFWYPKNFFRYPK